MPDEKYDRKYDRQAVLSEFKQRVIDLMQNHQPLPDTGIYDEPVRYFKANLKWTPVIFGLLTWAEDLAFWPDAINDLYVGIQQILIFEEGITLPDPPEIDCGDVEDCLESSTIINNIFNQIEIINNQIEIINENADELEETVEAGGNPLPDPPTMADASNDLCRGAHFISLRLRDRMLEYYDMASTLTLQEFVEAILNIASIGFIPAVEFWQFVFTLSSPTLDDSAAAYINRIEEAFFCAHWNLEEARTLIEDDPLIPTNEKALWLSVLDLYQQGQITEWGLVGTLDPTEVDCSAGCPWVVVFDFNGAYIPDGSETLIIDGNSWTVSGGAFMDGIGYVALADLMTIAHPLPQQCRLMHYYVSSAKGVPMLAADLRFWWKGSTGTGSEQFSAILRNLNTEYATYNFSVLGSPIMSQASISFDSFFPSGGFGQKIGWVKLVGTGSYPET